MLNDFKPIPANERVLSRYFFDNTNGFQVARDAVFQSTPFAKYSFKGVSLSDVTDPLFGVLSVECC
jgi:hypothetical protein